jgi:hypothetical protein
MKSKTGISVTLSDELYEHLQAEARSLRVPVKWLVASMVYDTFDTTAARSKRDARRVRSNAPEQTRIQTVSC